MGAIWFFFFKLTIYFPAVSSCFFTLYIQHRCQLCHVHNQYVHNFTHDPRGGTGILANNCHFNLFGFVVFLYFFIYIRIIHTVMNTAWMISNAISSLLLGIWDVGKETLEQGRLDGMVSFRTFGLIQFSSFPRSHLDLVVVGMICSLSCQC